MANLTCTAGPNSTSYGVASCPMYLAKGTFRLRAPHDVHGNCGRASFQPALTQIQSIGQEFPKYRLCNGSQLFPA
jgi:hypothetical protein